MGGWVPQLMGTLQSPDPSALGQGHGAGCVFSIALHEAQLVGQQAVPGQWERPQCQSCWTSNCHRTFGSRAGAALMTNTNSLPPGSHSWQGQAEPSDLQDVPVAQTASLGVSACFSSGQRQAGWPALGWLHCLPGRELAGGLQSMLPLSQRVGGMGASTVPWEARGGWVQLLRTCSSGPLHPFAGDDFGADGLGSSAICSWYSY